MEANVDPQRHKHAYARKNYWAKRSDYMYYWNLDYIIRTVGRDAKSLIDVGTGNSPYLEWFDWIEERVSVDIANPYRSETIRGIEGDVTKMHIEKKFDVCTCLQVLEHIDDAKAFSKKLFDLGDTVIISVPLGWKPGAAKGHVHDPVTEKKLKSWTKRDPDYQIAVAEPFRKNNGQRLIAVYLPPEADQAEAFNYANRRAARFSRDK